MWAGKERPSIGLGKFAQQAIGRVSFLISERANMSFIRNAEGDSMATYRPGRQPSKYRGDAYVWNKAPRTLIDSQGRRFKANSAWVDRADAERVQRSLMRQGKRTRIKETFRGWVLYSRTPRS